MGARQQAKLPRRKKRSQKLSSCETGVVAPLPTTAAGTLGGRSEGYPNPTPWWLPEVPPLVKVVDGVAVGVLPEQEKAGVPLWPGASLAPVPTMQRWMPHSARPGPLTYTQLYQAPSGYQAAASTTAAQPDPRCSTSTGQRQRPRYAPASEGNFGQWAPGKHGSGQVAQQSGPHGPLNHRAGTLMSIPVPMARGGMKSSVSAIVPSYKSTPAQEGPSPASGILAARGEEPRSSVPAPRRRKVTSASQSDGTGLNRGNVPGQGNSSTAIGGGWQNVDGRLVKATTAGVTTTSTGGLTPSVSVGSAAGLRGAFLQTHPTAPPMNVSTELGTWTDTLNKSQAQPPSTQPTDLESGEPLQSITTYGSLISLAILCSKDRKLLLSTIYTFVGTHRRLVKAASHTNWKNSIRHNLSLRKCFEKITRVGEDGKILSSFWCVNSLENLPKMAYETVKVLLSGNPSAPSHTLERKDPIRNVIADLLGLPRPVMVTAVSELEESIRQAALVAILFGEVEKQGIVVPRPLNPECLAVIQPIPTTIKDWPLGPGIPTVVAGVAGYQLQVGEAETVGRRAVKGTGGEATIAREGELTPRRDSSEQKDSLLSSDWHRWGSKLIHEKSGERGSDQGSLSKNQLQQGAAASVSGQSDNSKKTVNERVATGPLPTTLLAQQTVTKAAAAAVPTRTDSLAGRTAPDKHLDKQAPLAPGKPCQAAVPHKAKVARNAADGSTRSKGVDGGSRDSQPSSTVHHHARAAAREAMRKTTRDPLSGNESSATLTRSRNPVTANEQSESARQSPASPSKPVRSPGSHTGNVVADATNTLIRKLQSENRDTNPAIAKRLTSLISKHFHDLTGVKPQDPKPGDIIGAPANSQQPGSPAQPSHYKPRTTTGSGEPGDAEAKEVPTVVAPQTTDQRPCCGNASSGSPSPAPKGVAGLVSKRAAGEGGSRTSARFKRIIKRHVPVAVRGRRASPVKRPATAAAHPSRDRKRAAKAHPGNLLGGTRSSLTRRPEVQKEQLTHGDATPADSTMTDNVDLDNVEGNMFYCASSPICNT